MLLQSAILERDVALGTRILVVSQDAGLVEQLESELNHAGYSVLVAKDVTVGTSLVLQRSPHLAILDWVMVGELGLAFCKRLRLAGHTVPLIVLTAKGMVSDRIAGFNAGADDCLETPYYPDELLARVRVQLRRIRMDDPSTLSFEDVVLNRKTHEVYRANQLISLTAKEFALLEYLMLNCRQVLTRDQILEHVWGYDFSGDSNVIEVYIRYLRIKLEACNQQRLIHTVRYVGYVLRACN